MDAIPLHRYRETSQVVTIIDTDVSGGTEVGLVAMMIGDIVQCYSARAYDSPTDLLPGMFVKKEVDGTWQGLNPTFGKREMFRLLLKLAVCRH